MLLAELLEQRRLQVVVPAAGRLDDLRLERFHVERRQLSGNAQRVVDAHEHPLGQPQPPVDGLGAERVAQDLADPDPVGRVEAIAREEHEAGHEALVAVRAHEQPHALTLAELEDPACDPVELVDLHLDQLVARERVDDLDQRLVVVAAGREPGALAHGLRLAPQHRDVGRHLAVGGGRVEAEEAVLADDVAVVVEALDADVVEVARAVDRGARVGLGQDQDVRLAGERAHGRGQLRVGGRDVAAALAPQQPEPGALDAAQRLRVERVLAVAEEREVVVGQPREKGARLVGLGRVDAGRRRALELADQRLHAVAHRPPVVDHHADALEDAAQRLGQLVEALGLAIDLDVHVRLVAHDRVDEHVDAELAPAELHAHRVDEERHVVADDLDRGVRRLPAVLLERRVVHAHTRLAALAVAPERPVRQRGAVEVDRLAAVQVGRRRAPVIAAHERLGLGHLVGRDPLSDSLADRFDERRFGVVHTTGHAVSSPVRETLLRARFELAHACAQRL